MNQQTIQRSAPLAYRVIISTTKGLNIILSNKKIENERTYSHFVNLEQAEQFATDLETTLADGLYSDLNRCFLCGEPFTRREEVCTLTNEREAHYKCFLSAVRKRHLTFDDKKEGYNRHFPFGVPEYDFSNLNDTGREFKYAVQIVSKQVIHMWVQESHYHPKHHFCLTYDECVNMIQEIREKAYLVRSAEIGTCYACGRTVYIDEDRFQMASGELVHSRCMEKFVTGESATQVSFPATRTRLYDAFGFVGKYGDKGMHGLNPFPMD